MNTIVGGVCLKEACDFDPLNVLPLNDPLNKKNIYFLLPFTCLVKNISRIYETKDNVNFI